MSCWRIFEFCDNSNRVQKLYQNLLLINNFVVGVVSMRFEALETKMRVFETVNDYSVLPGIYIVARLNVRNLAGILKKNGKFKTIYDDALCDMMLITAEHLMDCGLKITYAHSQTDEISLLLAFEEYTFARQTNPIISTLVAEASVKLSFLLGEIICFDCRISQLPNLNEVINYFQWRSEDAQRKALQAHCFSALRREGKTTLQANRILTELGFEEKKQLLIDKGLNFYYVPNWQKRGIGLYWQDAQELANHKGDNKSLRMRKIRRDFDLPALDAYTTFLVNLIKHSQAISKELARVRGLGE